MNSHPQKRMFRFLAATTLLVWVMAQIACFVHCHYPGSQILSAHSAKSVSAERKCCSSQNSSDSEDSPAGSNASCMAFKNITLTGKSLIHTPPDISLLAEPLVFAFGLHEPTPQQPIPLVSFSGSSPPLLFCNPTLLSLPPPFFA